ncbi:hypothetical protein SAMN04489810_0418 [Microbacterium pygmaeum]|uniref:Uncharacterized protein n=1 Tax=Microbacterium pygmaeum TaxID=370764 RepID=A0A1G7UNE1_9MICO|nr:hypothetical protein SAMN04489810_0418 [Microbacterium pygmaeum]
MILPGQEDFGGKLLSPPDHLIWIEALTCMWFRGYLVK